MLVMAQSIAVTVAPYLHLGYLSAYNDPLPAGYQDAHFPFVVGATMGGIALLQGLHALWLRHKPRGIALPALISLVCLVITWRMLAGPGPPPEKITEARANRILALLRSQQHVAGTSPFTSLQDPKVPLPRYYRREGILGSFLGPAPEGKVCTDYWGREFALKSRKVTNLVTGCTSEGVAETREENPWEYWLVSAGPDGQFGTADDIVIDPVWR